MSIKLYACDCLYEETENNANTEVKGYILVSECDICKAKREAANLAAVEKKAQDDATESAKKAARESFISKLEALGTFTSEEIKAILG